MRYFILIGIIVGAIGCGDDMLPVADGNSDATATVERKVCSTVPSTLVDCGDGTSTCPDITVPPEGCLAWNGVAVEGVCVQACAAKP